MTDRERFKKLLSGHSLDTEGDVDYVVELLLASGATFGMIAQTWIFNNEKKVWEKI